MTSLLDAPVALAVGAHPNDMEFLCAGTLALLAQQGWRVTIATLSDGGLGSSNHTQTETGRIRKLEAERAAKHLEASYVCLNAPDLSIFANDALCRSVAALIRATAPTIVFTHPPHDYLLDHEETSRIVRHATFAASVPNYDTSDFAEGTSATPRRVNLYYGDAIDARDILGRPTRPGFVVDISGSIGTKEAMLAEHGTQRDWLRTQLEDHLYPEDLRDFSAQRGLLAGVPFGEGFTQHRGYAYPQGDLLREVLGPRVHPLAVVGGG
jgi:LmbE family N-acetylglucosaminyl deacetylase